MRRKPRLQVIHLVKVDLQAPGLRFLVTPGDPSQKLPLRARTTSQFLDEFGVQVAINGDYFLPWHSKAPWNYYPHVDDRVRVEGFAASRGIIYSKGLESSPTLYLLRNNEAQIGKSNAGFKKGVYNAISGNRLLVENGEPREVIYGTRSDRLDLHPRTAVGLSRDKRQLLLVTIDGRQPGYSEGATMLELRDMIVE